MASKKLLKKRVKRIVFEVLNDCDYIIETGGSGADKADQLIDEAVDFHDDAISKINAAKSKKDFSSIVEDVDKKDAEFMKKLNDIQ